MSLQRLSVVLVMLTTTITPGSARSVIDAGFWEDVQRPADCPDRQFYDYAKRACQPCSRCPANLIIRRPCLGSADTVCGPFVEFRKFQQSQAQSDQSHRHHHKARGNHDGGRQEDGVPDGSAELSAPDTLSMIESRNQWRRLAIAVFCILPVVGIIVVVFIVFMCHQRRKQTHKLYLSGEAGFMMPQTVTSPEPRYVAFPVKPSPVETHIYEELLDPAVFNAIDDVSKTQSSHHVTQDEVPFLPESDSHVTQDEVEEEGDHTENGIGQKSRFLGCEDVIPDVTVS